MTPAVRREYDMELPTDLRTALETELGDVPARQIAPAARNLSRRYRERHGRAETSFLWGSGDVTAYAAYRMPATYAAVRAALNDVRDRRPDFVPRTLLDLGSGPGTAAWAAIETWPSLERITILERDARMIDLGKRLAAHAREAVLGDATWRQGDLTGQWDVEPADLTIAAYVTGELPAGSLDGFIPQLWSQTDECGIVVEPGTPRGYALVREAGEAIERLGGHILAPFPLHWPCLESATDWVHFAERVGRTRLHRAAKGASLAYEDEKYSYVAFGRGSGLPIAARVVRQPQIRSGHVRLTLCTGAGIKHIVVPRSRREAYRRAKDLHWGSAIEPDEAHLFDVA